MSEQALSKEVREKIENLLDEAPVVLFMKGTKEEPMCGFSMRAVAVLNELGVPFKDVNVLMDDEVRQGIKVYGSWPTIPQLYVRKQLIGGSDIMLEMFQSGELEALFRSAGILEGEASGDSKAT